MYNWYSLKVWMMMPLCRSARHLGQLDAAVAAAFHQRAGGQLLKLLGRVHPLHDTRGIELVSQSGVLGSTHRNRLAGSKPLGPFIPQPTRVGFGSADGEGLWGGCWGCWLLDICFLDSPLMELSVEYSLSLGHALLSIAVLLSGV